MRKLCSNHAPLILSTVQPCDCEVCRLERQEQTLRWEVERLQHELQAKERSKENEREVRV